MGVVGVLWAAREAYAGKLPTCFWNLLQGSQVVGFGKGARAIKGLLILSFVACWCWAVREVAEAPDCSLAVVETALWKFGVATVAWQGAAVVLVFGCFCHAMCNLRM